MASFAEAQPENSRRRCTIPSVSPARAIAGIVAVGLLAGCVTGMLPLETTSTFAVRLAHFHPSDAEVPIGVVDEGWHTGLIVPAEAVGPSLAGLRHWFPEARYLVFGWGNRDFYKATNPGAGMAIAALFPSRSIVFVQALRGFPKKALAPDMDVRWLCVSRTGIRKLDVFLENYIKKGPHGELISVAPGLLPHSQFFASTGTYDAFHTCNTWTAQTLHVAGLPIGAGGVMFARQVISEIQLLHPCPK